MAGKRNTVQRQIVLDALKKLNTHPSVDEIYDQVYNEHPSISKATIYRNLRQLAAGGVIRQVSFPDGLERYDGCIEQHYHFRCRECGSIYDVDIGYLADINASVSEKYGFQVDGHDVVFSGKCEKCIETEHEETSRF